MLGRQLTPPRPLLVALFPVCCGTGEPQGTLTSILYCLSHIGPSTMSPGSVVGISAKCWFHIAGHVSPSLPWTNVWRAVRRGGQFGDTGGYNVYSY